MVGTKKKLKQMMNNVRDLGKDFAELLEENERLRKQAAGHVDPVLAKQEAMNEIFGGYELDEEVIIQKEKTEYVSCRACSGSGRAKLEGREDTVRCPDCGGRGQFADKRHVDVMTKVSALEYRVSRKNETLYVYVDALTHPVRASELRRPGEQVGDDQS